MQRTWAAIIFGAVGLLSIVYGIDHLTDVQKVAWTRLGEYSTASLAASIFTKLVVPTFLLILGLRLFLRPPGARASSADSTDMPASPQVPGMIAVAGLMIAGLYLFIGSARYVLAALWSRLFHPEDPQLTMPVSDIFSAALGVFLAVGAPGLRRLLIGRLNRIGPDDSGSLAERYLAAGLMVLGALTVGSVLVTFLWEVMSFLTGMVFERFEIESFAQHVFGPALKLAIGFYLLSGATTLRRFQLGLLQKQQDLHAGKKVE